MPNSTANLIVGAPKVGGYAFAAILGTTVPNDATTALNAAYKNLGFVSEDGLARSTEVTTEDVLDWSRDVIRVVQTDSSATFTLTLLEQKNEDTLNLFYGDGNVTVVTDESWDYSYDGQPLPHRQFAFELFDSETETSTRVVINDGQVISIGDVAYTKSALVGTEVTIKCFRDSSGKFFHSYSSVPTP